MIIRVSAGAHTLIRVDSEDLGLAEGFVDDGKLIIMFGLQEGHACVRHESGGLRSPGQPWFTHYVIPVPTLPTRFGPVETEADALCVLDLSRPWLLPWPNFRDGVHVCKRAEAIKTAAERWSAYVAAGEPLINPARALRMSDAVHGFLRPVWAKVFPESIRG